MLMIILYENHNFPLALKMQQLAEALYNLLGETTLDLSSTFNSISTYIQNEYLPKSNQTSTIPQDTITVLVSKAFSELYQLPPNGLLSSKGLYACYQGFAQYFPPHPCFFDEQFLPYVATLPLNSTVANFSPPVYELTPSDFSTSPNNSANNSPTYTVFNYFSESPLPVTYVGEESPSPQTNITPTSLTTHIEVLPISPSPSSTPSPSSSPSPSSTPPPSSIPSPTFVPYFAMNPDETLPYVSCFIFFPFVFFLNYAVTILGIANKQQII
jgi:hypothetical protein